MRTKPLVGILLAGFLVPACAGSGYRIEDGTDGECKPDHVRVAMLHLGARKNGRKTEESALSDLAYNTGEANKLIRMAASRGAKLVITPEYGNTGNLIPEHARPWLSTALPAPSYTPLFETDHEGVHDYVLEYARWAAELKIWIVTGVMEREVIDGETEYYNCGLVFDDRGCIRAKYRKINLWALTELSLKCGTVPTTFDTPFGRFGMMICSDALAPGLWDTLVDEMGADYLIMQSHWAPTPYIGTFAMGNIAGASGKPVLWSNHPGFLAGGAGVIRPGFGNDTSIGTFGRTGLVIDDLPIPERLSDHVARTP
jgi:transposase